MSTDPIDLSTTDGQLLARFAQSGEQWPFEVLVRRHGSLVLGVCRTVLGGAGALHDAEDAAQATFLTLARKSQSLGGYDSIAGWLYRVAWHIAKRTRSARELRSRRERDAATQRGAHLSKVEQQGSADDGPPLLEALHDELNKLPEKYRLPLILHHLEGWTEPEIAELLGCRVGTLSGRLSRGRQMLRERIGRHGSTWR
jgi:RNA polymerase sigma factor (sigma-70 family)